MRLFKDSDPEVDIGLSESATVHGICMNKSLFYQRYEVHRRPGKGDPFS